ncbi:hypothetical protein OCU04_006354 [Sclerotinia nivalis]|uniref:Selenoprotein W family protein n=1 Tax=Sclerotinia nivalis TaxID=352851 RepID=A0A9X0AMV2_9HELO|nr:hypothetical protein OCU04_006354 [Sclerotinia nivalis]
MDKMNKLDKIPMVSESGVAGRGIKLPRVTITFCTQCRWLLRAAYFAQELLSTFGNDIGEVALQPSTGGTFIVELFTNANATGDTEGEAKNAKEGEKEVKVLKHTLWDRKSEGGFPETKELKKRLRNIIDPSRDLGHVDGKKSTTTTMTSSSSITARGSSSNFTSKATEEEKEEKVKETETETETKEKENIGKEKLDGEKQDGEKLGEEKVNERGKIVITGLEGEGGFGFCVPGEDCGGF